jgi:hypothetical protein
MQIDRQQFMEEGYLILRNVVPPGLLDPLRAAVEHMVEGRRQPWPSSSSWARPP